MKKERMIDFNNWGIIDLLKFIKSTENEMESWIEQKLKYIDYKLSQRSTNEKYRTSLLLDQEHYMMFLMAYKAFYAMQRQYKNIVSNETEVAAHQLLNDLKNDIIKELTNEDK